MAKGKIPVHFRSRDTGSGTLNLGTFLQTGLTLPFIDRIQIFMIPFDSSHREEHFKKKNKPIRQIICWVISIFRFCNMWHTTQNRPWRKFFVPRYTFLLFHRIALSICSILEKKIRALSVCLHGLPASQRFLVMEYLCIFAILTWMGQPNSMIYWSNLDFFDTIRFLSSRGTL